MRSSMSVTVVAVSIQCVFIYFFRRCASGYRIGYGVGYACTQYPMVLIRLYINWSVVQPVHIPEKPDRNHVIIPRNFAHPNLSSDLKQGSWSCGMAVPSGHLYKFQQLKMYCTFNLFFSLVCPPANLRPSASCPHHTPPTKQGGCRLKCPSAQTFKASG